MYKIMIYERNEIICEALYSMSGTRSGVREVIRDEIKDASFHANLQYKYVLFEQKYKKNLYKVCG